jgi:hypothetical protein
VVMPNATIVVGLCRCMLRVNGAQLLSNAEFAARRMLIITMGRDVLVQIG